MYLCEINAVFEYLATGRARNTVIFCLFVNLLKNVISSWHIFIILEMEILCNNNNRFVAHPVVIIDFYCWLYMVGRFILKQLPEHLIHRISQGYKYIINNE